MTVSWGSASHMRTVARNGSRRRLLSSFTSALTATAISGAAIVAAGTFSAGVAQANPCDSYKPSITDQLAATSLGDSLGSSKGLLAPTWAEGHPEGLPQLVGPTKAMNFLTGPNSPDALRMNGLNSTDLGISWDAGDGRVLSAFGDSFTCGKNSDGWHSNSLFETHDVNPSNGIFLEGPATGSRSEEFLPKSLKIDNVEMTIIPTAGIEVNGNQYLDFMSVKHWGTPGNWTTNYAATAESKDGGKTWSVVPNSYRTNKAAAKDPRLPNIPAYKVGADNFQMTAFSKAPTDDGFVYVHGTPNGRSGSAYSARVPKASFPDWSTAEFWNGSNWSSSMSDAVPAIDGQVSELSVSYNKEVGAWLALYGTPTGIVLRKADNPQGPWGEKKLLVSNTQVFDLYGGFMYPHQVDGNLYWVATTWSSYNAMVFKTDLKQVFK